LSSNPFPALEPRIRSTASRRLASVEGDYAFADDQLLVGCELLEIVQQLVGDSGHWEKLHCAGRRIKRPAETDT
jgi:hypothetical protein